MNPIHFHDPVYGEVSFTEPLLIEIYHSQAVQRLRHIYQGGITAFIKPERQTTRLDHSLGVAALLRRLGAAPVEQAAGLIHDVPHTAMSHVIDFVFPNHNHTYHEEHRFDVLRQSDLPGILGRYDLDWQWLSDAENFSLLEQPLPRLCADRLDYFLRDGIVDWQFFTFEAAQSLLDHIGIWQGQMVVNDLDAARWLADQFMRLDDHCWCSVQEVGWYAAAAEALRAALHHQIITEADFAGTDVALFNKVQNADIPEIQNWLAYLHPDVNFVRDEAKPDLFALPKVRAIDPPVRINKTTRSLSELDPAFAQRRTAYIASKQGEWGLRKIT